LQVLQDHEFLRLGAKEPTRVDVRVMAATHCDLEDAIADGRFREDLYYRLNVINIEIPSLRQRKDEILKLADHLLHKHGNQGGEIPEISPLLKQALLAHDWPGNIRELENVMRKLLVLRDCDMVCEELQRTRRKPSVFVAAAAASGGHEQTQADVPVAWVSAPVNDGPGQIEAPDLGTPASSEALVPGFAQSADGAPLERVDQLKKNAEANVILSALKSTRWNRRQAAEVLKIDYKALLYKMKKLGIST